MIVDAFEMAGFHIVVNQSIRPIKRYTQALFGDQPQVCVDIGANDGLNQSNSLFLFMQGWTGLCLEVDAQALERLRSFYGVYLPQVQAQQLKVTPENTVVALQQAHIPRDFGFLSLDIDSYDYDVLAAVLAAFRPVLLCVEINEKIPPPLYFRVKYRPEHRYTGDHFYGMSLTACAELARKHDYDLLELNFNNAFLVAREQNRWSAQTPEAAYRAYRRGPKPEWNRNMEPLLSLPPQEGLAFLQRHFQAYATETYVLNSIR